MTVHRQHQGDPEMGLPASIGFQGKNQASVRRVGFAVGLAIATLLLTTTGGHTQDLWDQPSMIPPPPPVPVPQAPSASPSLPREAIFQAPVDSQRSAASYVVYVNGDSPYLLQQVQTIESGAFVQQYQGRSVIQVGTYSDEATARQRIEALRMQGITAELGYNNVSYPPTASQSSPYLIVIPGAQAELPNLLQQAIRLGIRQEAMQMKDAPRGWHLEIGPFKDYNEAKEVDQYLRRGGMDSRVFYSR